MTPIAVFTYNRLDHTQLVFKSLLNNSLAKETDLYIFSDGGKNKYDDKKVLAVREYLDTITGFKTINKVFNNENKGLATSIIEGITMVFKKFNTVIVLEDDLECSPHFLKYMNEALDFYDPSNVWSISGYTPNINLPSSYPFDTYISFRNCSWGWATWKQNWNLTNWEIDDFNDFISSKDKRKKFERGGNDLSIMLLKKQKRLINSWSILFNYAGFKYNLPTVYPVKSLIKNIGVDGSGTNMSRSKKYSVTLSKYPIHKTQFCNNFQEDIVITKRFKKFYNTSIFRKFINYIKLNLTILSIVKGKFI